MSLKIDPFLRNANSNNNFFAKKILFILVLEKNKIQPDMI